MFQHLAEPGQRQPVFARHGVVTTSQPLAAAAGLRMLQQGGSAADAAIATAAALTVLEPCSNGLGSDAFAIVWDGERLTGLNGSGRAPAALTADVLRDAGRAEVPLYGWEAVTVPGAVRAWADLHARYGRLPFAQLLEPAIEYASDGFPVSPVVAWGWHAGVIRAHAGLSGDPFDEFLRVFAPDGATPAPGQLMRLTDHAATLRQIAESDGAAFYEGELAERIAAHAAATGGYLTTADLAAHTSDWVDPISAHYRDHEVWEIPPNGQGIATLMALRVLDGYDPADVNPDTAAGLHRAIEATKLALTNARAFVTDPAAMDVAAEELLSDDYAAATRARIGARAATPSAEPPTSSDTVYLAAADADGMMVSFIQSNFHGFGSHIVVPGTGISLQNRGSGFSLDPAHPNVLAPGKRPFHTIIPGFLTRDGAPIGPFGVMGGHMQAQGHLQVALATVDRAEDPMTALARPRWFWDRELRIMTESPLAGELAALGHDVVGAPSRAVYGRGQIIWALDGAGGLVGERPGTRGYVAASEPRADGVPMGW